MDSNRKLSEIGVLRLYVERIEIGGTGLISVVVVVAAVVVVVVCCCHI